MARRSIVIIEDDENVAQLLAFVLARDGFAPEVVADGRAAEAFVAAHEPPAAVVLDIMLPYRDGFEVAAAIRADARWKDVPVLALTARTQPSDLERARALGIGEHVAKPFHPRTLASRIRALLGDASPGAPSTGSEEVPAVG
jgi:DNA-binding response OmpR family regulator